MEKAKQYRIWIDKHYPTPESALAQCGPACIKMRAAFPELKITNGFVKLIGQRETRMHWWLVDAEENIVDPTTRQYEWAPIEEYLEIDDAHPARNYPQSRCHNCGEYYYVTKGLSEGICSDACFQAYAAYLTNPG